jgi:hypothetical protein
MAFFAQSAGDVVAGFLVVLNQKNVQAIPPSVYCCVFRLAATAR